MRCLRASTTLLLLSIGFGVLPNLRAADPPTLVRVLKIKAVADEEFRKKKSWEKEIRKHIEWADEKFRKVAGIGLEIVATQPWETHGSKSMPALLKELRAGVDKGDAEIVIGFTGHKPPQLTLFLSTVTIRFNLPFIAGIAMPMGDRAVVRRDASSKETRHTLLHEIAHLFGGLHVSKKSILQAGGRHRATFSLDSFNQRIFDLTSSRDFGVEIRDLPKETLDEILDVFRERPTKEDTDIDTYLRVGYLLMMAGRAEDAVAEFKSALEKDPKSSKAIVENIIIPELVSFHREHDSTVESRYMLGQSYIFAQEWEDAMEQLIPNCPSKTPHALSCSLLGGAFFKEQDFAQAERALLTAIEADDSIVDAYSTLGNLYSLADRPEEGMEHYNRALELDEENVVILFNKGLAYLVTEFPGPAENTFRKLLELKEDHDQATVKLALALARQNKLKEARKLIGPFERRNTLPAFFIRDMAEIYLHDGDTKKAWKYLEFAKRGGLDLAELEEDIRNGSRKPRRSKTKNLVKQAEAYYDSDDYATARQLLEQAIEQNPGRAEAFYWLGRVAKGEDELDESADLQRKAIELDKKDPFPFLELGKLAYDRKDYATVVTFLDQYVKLEKYPGSYPNYLLGRSHYELGNLDDAEERLLKAIRRRSSYGNALYILAQIYRKRDCTDDAIKELRLAVEVRSMSKKFRMNAHYQLATLLMEKDPQEASRHAGIARRLGHDEAEDLLTQLGKEPSEHSPSPGQENPD